MKLYDFEKRAIFEVTPYGEIKYVGEIPSTLEEYLGCERCYCRYSFKAIHNVDIDIRFDHPYMMAHFIRLKEFNPELLIAHIQNLISKRFITDNVVNEAIKLYQDQLEELTIHADMSDDMLKKTISNSLQYKDFTDEWYLNAFNKSFEELLSSDKDTDYLMEVDEIIENVLLSRTIY